MHRKFFIVAGLVALVAMSLTPIFWPITTDPTHLPPTSLMPWFILINILSTITFGIGVSFLLFGYRMMRSVEHGFGLPFWAYFSTLWILVSWWPHENLHRVIEYDFHSLVYIEYGFHLTIYIAGVILAAYLIRQFKSPRTP